MAIPTRTTITKPWFAAIYATIHEWYESKHGPLNVSTIDIYIGLVVHAGIPHSIAIPRTTSKIQPDGLVAVTFPSKLYADETPEKWLKPKDSLAIVTPQGAKEADLED